MEETNAEEVRWTALSDKRMCDSVKRKLYAGFEQGSF